MAVFKSGKYVNSKFIFQWSFHFFVAWFRMRGVRPVRLQVQEKGNFKFKAFFWSERSERFRIIHGEHTVHTLSVISFHLSISNLLRATWTVLYFTPPHLWTRLFGLLMQPEPYSLGRLGWGFFTRDTVYLWQFLPHLLATIPDTKLTSDSDSESEDTSDLMTWDWASVGLISVLSSSSSTIVGRWRRHVCLCTPIGLSADRERNIKSGGKNEASAFWFWKTQNG